MNETKQRMTRSELLNRRLDSLEHDTPLLLQAQRSYVDKADQRLEGLIRDLSERGFWGRLRWLFTGR